MIDCSNKLIEDVKIRRNKMPKTKEELEQLKEDYKNLVAQAKELSEEELENVTGIILWCISRLLRDFKWDII